MLPLILILCTIRVAFSMLTLWRLIFPIKCFDLKPLVLPNPCVVQRSRVFFFIQSIFIKRRHLFLALPVHKNGQDPVESDESSEVESGEDSKESNCKSNESDEEDGRKKLGFNPRIGSNCSVV